MKRITITATRHESVVVLAVSGHLDGTTAPELERAIHTWIDDGVYQIVADFKELDFMSSAGLGVLMGAIHKVREKHGDIRLARPNAGIRRLIELMGFNHLYQIFDTEENAIASFQ
ncbi:MAG: STAS domain-containing protein [Leptospirales bacterium]|jgi:anti-sigma B factor antagonist